MDGNPILTEGHKNQIPRTKRVKNLSTGKIFEGANQAATTHNVRSQLVQAVCSGKYQTCKGMSFCYLDDSGSEILTASHHKYFEHQKQVSSTTYAAYHASDTNYTKPYLFDSIDELCQTLNLPKSHILAVCRGERQHVNGYRIARYDKDNNQPILTDAHKRPIRKILRKVLCLDDNQLFDTPAAAGRHYGLDSQQISLCCRGILKSTGRGSTRKRFAYADEQGNPILTPKHQEPLSTRRTRLFCPQLGREFQSVAEFCRETGVPAKRAKKHLLNPSVSLDGLELVEL